jgi:hypothetical protein
MEDSSTVRRRLRLASDYSDCVYARWPRRYRAVSPCSHDSSRLMPSLLELEKINQRTSTKDRELGSGQVVSPGRLRVLREIHWVCRSRTIIFLAWHRESELEWPTSKSRQFLTVYHVQISNNNTIQLSNFFPEESAIGSSLIDQCLECQQQRLHSQQLKHRLIGNRAAMRNKKVKFKAVFVFASV